MDLGAQEAGELRGTDNSEEADSESSSPEAEVVAVDHSWQMGLADRVGHALGGHGVVGRELVKDEAR